VSTQGIILIITAALVTGGGNMILRAGLLRAGGFNPTDGQLLAGLFRIFTEPLVLGGFSMYVLAALLWFWIQSTERLGTSYVLLVATTFTTVTIGSIVFFHEPISFMKVVGIGVILAGIAIVGLNAG
jgi:multidrug transporter EmrE-like cation transporter